MNRSIRGFARNPSGSLSLAGLALLVAACGSAPDTPTGASAAAPPNGGAQLGASAGDSADAGDDAAPVKPDEGMDPSAGPAAIPDGYASEDAWMAADQDALEAAASSIATAAESMPGVYASMSLDVPNHVVNLYVTDMTKVASLLAAAKNVDPSVDLSVVKVSSATFSETALNDATDRLTDASDAGKLPFALYSVAQVDNGDSLELHVDDATKAEALASSPIAALGGETLAVYAGVPLTFVTDEMPTATNKQDDTRPFIGGDGLSYEAGGEITQCTAGIPVENGKGEDFILTANHCFPPGVTVKTWDGIHTVGKVISDRSVLFDAELIDTGFAKGQGALAEEAEGDVGANGTKWLPLVATTKWAKNETVCQDGMSMFFTGRGAVCDIKVVGGVTFLTRNDNGTVQKHRGVMVRSDNGKGIGIPGDSGAVVFSMHAKNTRNAVGLLSAANNCSGSGENTKCLTAYFIAAGDIYSALGVHLDPHH